MGTSLLPVLIVLFSAVLSSATFFHSLPSLTQLPGVSQITQPFLPRPQHANKGVSHAFLKAHNDIRAKYGQKPLRWDRTLARNARRYAYKMRNICNLTHSGTHYGENIFVGEGHWTVREAVEEWAKERFYYHWSTNSCNPDKKCGHFTQMIWGNTEALGCAKIHCNATFIFVTCNYYPTGNILGHWPINNYRQFMH